VPPPRREGAAPPPSEAPPSPEDTALLREGDEEERANKMKVDRFIRKPFDTNELTNLVQELLQNIESKSDDWSAMAEEYVSARTVTAEEVRSVNEEFKQEIIEAFERQESDE